MWHVVDPSSLIKKCKTMLKMYCTRNKRRLIECYFDIFNLQSLYEDFWKSITNKLTIRYNEDAANASGIATEVILSYGPFKYVCLWTLWKYFCFSIIFSRGLNGGSDILVGTNKKGYSIHQFSQEKCHQINLA